MKNLLLSSVCMLVLLTNVGAQSPRMNIFEEFSSANCGPCAQVNPGLLALINSNSSKIFLMKYQHNIPAADAMYNQNTSEVDARADYYTVIYNPFGKVNGAQLTTGQQYNDHPGYFTQAVVNGLPTTSHFTLTVLSAAMNTAKDSIKAKIYIKCTQAFTATTFKLRAALTETVEYTSAPGANGEKKFENVMRKMYPDATGSPLSASWTNGQSDTITVSGPIPAYVNKNSTKLNFVVFMQDDANKKVEQAAIKLIGGSAPTSVANVLQEESLDIYPNPAQDQLNVAFQGISHQKIVYRITDILGRQALADITSDADPGANNKTINIQNLRPGVYFLNIITEEGIAQRRFIRK